MQAYQSPPCPYCGTTWNQPGAQSCANCQRPLPPPQPGYGPPGYQNYPSSNYPASYLPPGYAPQPVGYGEDSGYGAYAPRAAAKAPGMNLRLFGQTVTLPVALPPTVTQFVPAIVNIALGLTVALVLFVMILPAVASNQLSGTEQVLATTVAHRSKVDAGFASLFAPDPGTNDLNVIHTQAVKSAQSVNGALAIVRADEGALDGANLRLMVLQWLAPRYRAAIAKERVRLAAARDGLSQADMALTAGANQAKVLLPIYEAMIDFTKMYMAMVKRDLAGAGAPYPDAHKKVTLAMSLDHAPGVPEAVAKQASAFNDLLNNFESLVQAVQSKDAAGTKKYSDAVEAGLKTMSALPTTVPADYRIKTYGGMQKSFDAVMISVKSGS